MSKKILGLDVGISSIGWSIILKDEQNIENSQILQAGVRIFTQAENPKNGSSLALPRREARGSRRVLKRKRKRLYNIKRLFEKYLNIPFSELEDENNIFIKKTKKIDVWELRSEALKRILTPEEFARILTNIAKRRGYKSNRKSNDENEKDSEKKKILSAINKNRELLNKYLTIGEAIYESTKDIGIRRNKKDNYSHSISRDMLEDEVSTIFKKQREYGNALSTNEFENRYKEIAFKQNPLSSIDSMVGHCLYEKDIKRAPKRSFSAEEFVTLSKLINTKLVLPNKDERCFDKNEIAKLMDVCKNVENPTFKTLRKAINLDEDVVFKSLTYFDKKTGEVKDAESEKFKSELKGFHAIRKCTERVLSKTHWHNISGNKELLNSIAVIFSNHKDEELIEKELRKLEFTSLTQNETELLIKELLKEIDFSKYNNLSIFAIEKLLPYMYDGKRYDEAVNIVYPNININKKSKLLRALNEDEENELTNPVVKRAVSQTRKVINAVIRKHGSLDELHIELSREVRKSLKDRKKIEKEQKDYQENKKLLANEFFEIFERAPKGREFEKFKLWKEQDGYCIYSMSKIKIEDLLKDGFCEIDHILPFSRSWDNSKSNKVLCLTSENQAKRNQTPYEYFKTIQRDWNEYKNNLNILKNIEYKTKKLLKENFDENSQNEFKSRNFTDNAYAARFLKNFIENNLVFNSNLKKPVVTINGMLTSNLRYQWGIKDKNRVNHLHHAEDATIIAFATFSEVQRFAANSAKIYEFGLLNKEDKKKIVKLLPPFTKFKTVLEETINNIFVSYAPRRKVTGAAHKETIYSNKSGINDGFKVNKGIAGFGEVKRIDVFKKDNKYHFVYLYSFDFLKKELSNKTIKGVLVDDSFEFLFSIFKDEYISLKQKGRDEVSGYFKFARTDGRFVVIEHNISEFEESENRISTGSLEWIKKYQVGVLGDKFEIKKEKRVGPKRKK